MKTQNFIGKCRICKSTVRKSNGKSVFCPRQCHSIYGEEIKIVFKKILGFVSDHKCDARCEHATGNICECSCGGLNHGSAHQVCFN